MGVGESKGEHLAVSVISHVVQMGRSELLMMRRQLLEGSRRKGDGKHAPRKEFHAVETALMLEESDQEIFDRLFTLFDKTGGGRVVIQDFVCGLAVVTKGQTKDRMLLACEAFDLDNKGLLTEAELKRVLRNVSHTFECLGDPPLDVTQIDDIVQDVFLGADHDSLVKQRLRYGSESVLSNLYDHPVIDAFMSEA